MTELQSRPLRLADHYDALRELLRASGPEWLQPLRERAIQSFREFGIPTTRDEEFRYLPLRHLEGTRFQPAYGATVDRGEIARQPLGELDAVTLAFVNGEYAPELSSADILPDGVYVGPLREAYASHEPIIRAHLGEVASLNGKLGRTNDERFVRLNTAFLDDGAFVYVPKGIALERPIHLLFVTKANHGPLAAHPRALVVLEEAAEAKLVETYLGLGGEAFNNPVTEMWVGRRAHLEHARVQLESPETTHIANLSVRQAEESVFTSNNVALGARTARVDVYADLQGEHIECWLNGAYVGTGTQLLDNHTRIDHAKPNCQSFEIYKGILRDEATGVFNGKIFVYEDAQKTDAKQTNQALLLSPTATINTKPQLEIFADDVKCTHGATVGQLRPDALFYLRARGVPKPQAEALLVYAFAAEVLEKITLDPVRETLERLLFDKLGTAAQTA